MKVYIAGGLTNLSDRDKIKQFYEGIRNVCLELGLEPYLPHLVTDPVEHDHLGAREVYKMDYQAIKDADLMLAYLGEPSLGVGIELEMAKFLGKQIILHNNKDNTVSRMAKGMPTVEKHIEYADFAEGTKKIREVLKKYAKKTKC